MIWGENPLFLETSIYTPAFPRFAGRRTDSSCPDYHGELTGWPPVPARPPPRPRATYLLGFFLFGTRRFGFLFGFLVVEKGWVFLGTRGRGDGF